MPTYSKFLITGGSGFLGWNLAKYAAEMYDISFTYAQHPVSIPDCQEYHLELQDKRRIEDLVDEVQPDVIIHTAALANVDICEQRRSLAYDINVAATTHLARCAQDLACRFVYISTDLVFDGEQGMYTERDRAHPVNYYGETKLSGERAVMSISTDYLIVRMALMYGIGNGMNGSFTDWIREGLEHQKAISLFTDQYRTPLFVMDGVRALLELVEQSGRNQLYHLAGSERLNRYEFGKKFAQTFNYSSTMIQPIQMQEITTLAQRGKDCSLNSQKIQPVLSFALSDASAGLQKMKQLYSQS